MTWLLASRGEHAPARLLAVDAKGAVKWSRDVACAARSLTVGSARLYLTSSTELEVVDAADGRSLARFGTASPACRAVP
jgi:hypothetical protein